VSFFVEDNCLPLLTAFVLIGIILFRQGKVIFLTYLGFLFFLLLTFITGKTREGSHWPFYSYSRMYLGLPFALSYFVAIMRVRKDMIFSIVIGLTLIFSVYKLYLMNRVIAYHTFHLHATGVRIVPLPTVLDGMQVYKRVCDEHGAKRLVISSIFWQSTYLTYGGQAVYPDFPETEETYVDRRYWVREGKKNEVNDKFMVISINYVFDTIVKKKYAFDVEKLDDWGLFLIKNNKLTNKEFLDILRDIED
jgi:hypothetical protein